MEGPVLLLAENLGLVLVAGLALGVLAIAASAVGLRRARRRGRPLQVALWTVVLSLGIGSAGFSGFAVAVVGPDLLENARMIGREAPELRWAEVGDGAPAELGDLAGQVVLVNVWATWCPPCRAEMPDLDRLQASYGERGLVILHISDESPETLRAYLESRPMTTRHGYVERIPWPVIGRPTSFLVDRRGVVRRVIQGHRSYPQFERLVLDVL